MDGWSGGASVADDVDAIATLGLLGLMGVDGAEWHGKRSHAIQNERSDRKETS